MKLSNFSHLVSVDRDVEFLSLGRVNSIAPGTLVYADSHEYLRVALGNPNVCGIITLPEFGAFVPESLGLIRSDRPRHVFYDLHDAIIDSEVLPRPFNFARGVDCKIHPSAVVSKDCRLGDRVKIGEFAVIRDCVWIGSDVTIEPGAQIGVGGILYRTSDRGIRLIRHAGHVVIGDSVSILSNAVVVRSVHQTSVTEVDVSSIVGIGSIVGHDAKIGPRVVLSNQCVVARGVTIEHDVFIGTHSMILEYLVIGAGARIMAGSTVINDVPAGKSVSGNFASSHHLRMLTHTRHLRGPRESMRDD